MVHFLVILSIVIISIFFIIITRLLYQVSSFGESSGLHAPEQATHHGVLYSNVDQPEIMFTPAFRQQDSIDSIETQEDFVTSQRENEQPI